ncbi:MAG: HDOD domain-containing protein [candidate division Zixibacteria bacterium]|nr:HDOD domain-containing protein [candidate division Zixibacteria bacterium]
MLELATKSLDEHPLPLSTVARSVIRLTANPAVSMRELSRAVSADPGLSGKLIKMANSAFYAGPEAVTSITGAVFKLGITATRSVAMTASVQALFRDGDPDGLEDRLWRHSLAVGVAARVIAQEAGSSLAEEAFLSGLLHDIAKLLLLQRFPAVYKPIFKRTLETGEPPLDVEMASMGFTHADLGAMILERWAFEPAPIGAIRFHHDPDRVGRYTDTDPANTDRATRLLAHAVSLANVIAKRLDGTAPTDHESPLTNGPTPAFFGFTTEQLDRIIQNVSYRVGDELQVFGQPDAPIYVSEHRDHGAD